MSQEIVDALNEIASNLSEINETLSAILTQLETD
jgi:hypothetical protein